MLRLVVSAATLCVVAACAGAPTAPPSTQTATRPASTTAAATAVAVGSSHPAASGSVPPSGPASPRPSVPGTSPAVPSATPLELHTDRDFALTFRDLVADADAVVIGTLEPRAVVHSTSEADVIHHLAQDFRVETTIAGDLKDGQTVPVKRSVRAADGVPFVEFRARPLTVGARYLLFLRDESGIYVTSGGPQGQYEIVDGVLQAVTLEMPVVDVLHGKTVSAASDLVAAAQR